MSTHAMARLVTADRGDAGKRLDLVLRRHLTDVATATRTRIQSWIANGQVAVNGTPILRPATRAAPGDAITVTLDFVPSRRMMVAENAKLDILHEDEYLLVINKPAGLIVHPAYKHAEGTLMNALLWHARRWSKTERPSLVGRLDKFTSGIVLVAKSPAVHAALQRAMAAKDAEKDYLAVVYGRVSRIRGRIDLRLALDRHDRRRVVASETTGAASVTNFERLARIPAPRAGLALLRCRLATGRRHQIRVHLAACGWPLVGDPTYGEPRWSLVTEPTLAATLRAFPRQALHAWRLALAHPITGDRLNVEAPLSADFRALLTAIGLSAGVPRPRSAASVR
jgi:23S rRNA pseudouridine1911/1915/1917 synthase